MCYEACKKILVDKEDEEGEEDVEAGGDGDKEDIKKTT
jgi:hypothetical protein